MEFNHISVLLNECIENLQIKPGGVYVDGTLGGGGHSLEISKYLNENGMLIGIDQDTDAIKTATQVLSQSKAKMRFVHDNFSNIKIILRDLNISQIDGMLLDLGVSSYQLDEKDRGFSYHQDAPLDMRMNREQDFSAFHVVNEYGEKELERIIREFGEERWASRIAQFIVAERQKEPVQTTFQLVSIIKKAVPRGARSGGPHPAKRTFQAIRIEVNHELDILVQTIEDCLDLLGPGGRLCMITFHSLEDRIVKNTFRKWENPCTCPPDFPVCVCGLQQKVRVITRKPVLPTVEEIDNNNRARSAKLRVAEKLARI